MAIAAQHVRYLRGLAHSLSPIVLVGNKGISDNLLDELKQALDRHELVKLRVLAETREERDQLVLAIQRHTGAELIQRVGHTATFYRQHPTRPKIALPGSRPPAKAENHRAGERLGPRETSPSRSTPGPQRLAQAGDRPFRRQPGDLPVTKAPGPRFARGPAASAAQGRPSGRAQFAPTSLRSEAGPGARRSIRETSERTPRGAVGRPFSRDPTKAPRRGATELAAPARRGGGRFAAVAAETSPRRERRDTAAAGPWVAKAERAFTPGGEAKGRYRVGSTDRSAGARRGSPAGFGPTDRPQAGRRAQASPGVQRERLGAPRRERGAIEAGPIGRDQRKRNPYGSWSAGRASGKPTASAPRSDRAPLSGNKRPGPPGTRGKRPFNRD